MNSSGRATTGTTEGPQPSRLGDTPRRLRCVAALLVGLLSGCSALSNPVAVGIPVHRLPAEVLGRPREEEIPIPLTRLRTPPPEEYRLDAGDTLGVWIEGVLGTTGQAPPVSQPPPGSNLSPSLGFPVPVREDGTISLPFVEAIHVKGLTVTQVRDELVRAYTVRKEILKRGNERILVDLQRPRQYHVLVIRQDSGGLATGGGGLIGSTKRGTGFQLDLPAYENDVLNALARTGGFPGLDAKNEVVVERGASKDGPPPVPSAEDLECYVEKRQPPPGWGGGQQIRIPLRLRPDQPLPFTAEDVALRTGDVLYIDTRDPEVYYIAGLLGSAQFVLPRDYDLRVLDAIMVARGPLFNGGNNANNLSGTIVTTGLGNPSPSLVTVLRRTPDGGQIPIKIDLHKAMRDRREDILVQAKDIILLQETPGEAIVRYLTQQVKFNFASVLFRRQDAILTNNITAP